MFTNLLEKIFGASIDAQCSTDSLLFEIRRQICHEGVSDALSFKSKEATSGEKTKGDV